MSSSTVSPMIRWTLPLTKVTRCGGSAARAYATAGVYVEVMNGPNAGQIAPMTKREFVLGQRGATKAPMNLKRM